MSGNDPYYLKKQKEATAAVDMISPLQGIEIWQWQFTQEQQSYSIDLPPFSLCLCLCLSGKVILLPSDQASRIQLHAQEASLLSFPSSSWKLDLKSHSGHVVILQIELSALHKIISAKYDAQKVRTIDYSTLPEMISFSPALKTNLQQLFSHNISPPFAELYTKAKFLEVFSVLMHNAFSSPTEECPFMLSRDVEQKLFEARRIIHSSLDTVPDPAQLALQVDLNKTTLMQGFKFVFKKSLHHYYSDYRMEKAIELLKSGKFLVKEIAYQIGYQNPSHFITAFKKKYGSTPKQYLKTSSVT